VCVKERKGIKYNWGKRVDVEKIVLFCVAIKKKLFKVSKLKLVDLFYF